MKTNIKLILAAVFWAAFLMPAPAQALWNGEAACLFRAQVEAHIATAIHKDMVIRTHILRVGRRLALREDGKSEEEIDAILDAEKPSFEIRGKIERLEGAAVKVFATNYRHYTDINILSDDPHSGLVFNIHGEVGKAGAVEFVFFDKEDCAIGKGSMPLQIYQKMMAGRGV